MSTTTTRDDAPWLSWSNPWAWAAAFIFGFGCLMIEADINRHWLGNYSSRDAMCRARMNQIVDDAFPRWASEHPGACPATIDELLPHGVDIATDLWGRDYVIRCAPDDPRSFALTSRGPDRTLGTADDIRSWDPSRGQ